MTSSHIQSKVKNGIGQRQIRPQLEHDIGKTAPVLAVFRDCGKTAF